MNVIRTSRGQVMYCQSSRIVRRKKKKWLHSVTFLPCSRFYRWTQNQICHNVSFSFRISIKGNFSHCYQFPLQTRTSCTFHAAKHFFLLLFSRWITMSRCSIYSRSHLLYESKNEGRTTSVYTSNQNPF